MESFEGILSCSQLLKVMASRSIRQLGIALESVQSTVHLRSASARLEERWLRLCLADRLRKSNLTENGPRLIDQCKELRDRSAAANEQVKSVNSAAQWHIASKCCRLALQEQFCLRAGI